MIQDIFPHVFDNRFDTPDPSPADAALLFFEGAILLKKDGEVFSFPTVGELSFLENKKFMYLFSIDQIPAFLVGAAVDRGSLPHGFELKPTSFMRSELPGDSAFLGATALHLSSWIEKNRFCGVCGAEMGFSKTERALYCESCKNTVYPAIAPAVIVAVTDGDKLLMGRKSANTTHYSLIAGYCEIGESLEATVMREVYEEAGLKVKNIKYYASQPWAFSSAVMIGFTAELDGDPTVTLNDHELYEAVFFTRKNIPEPQSLFSVGSTMIDDFLKGKIGK